MPATSQQRADTAIQTEPSAEELIFLGTGTSGCVPVIGCLTAENPSCPTCTSPLKENKRLNTGALVRIKCPPDGHGKVEWKNLLIDCGKTFYPSALLHFPTSSPPIRRIDALLLTHPHADAFFGLDDLRSWTLPGPSQIQPHIPVYCDAGTLQQVKATFPYLVDRNMATGGGDVAAFSWHVFDSEGEVGDEGFRIPECGGIKVVPLPVEHGRFMSTGAPFMSLGFRVCGFSYVSDCSGVPEETARRMRGSRVVVMDGLKPDPHASHFSVDQGRMWVRDVLGSGTKTGMANGDGDVDGQQEGEEEEWQEEPYTGPQSTYLTGFSHAIEHVAATKEFTEWGLRDGGGMYVRPAYDGLRIGKDGRPVHGT